MGKHKRTKRGFSIGEVLVAMFILLVGIVDAVFLTVRSVNDLGNSRDSVIATLLAQEGTELVRNVRDNNVTEPNSDATYDCGGSRCTAFDQSTGYGFPSRVLGSTGVWCVADYTLEGNGSFTCGSTNPSADNNKLCLNESTNFYEHSCGGNVVEDARTFRRMIYVKYGCTVTDAPCPVDNLYADVTSVVTWSDGEFPPTASGEIDNIEQNCLKSQNCAYAQTTLSSWINYGE